MMNKTLKNILIFTLILLIGFVIGFLTNGRMTKKRIDRMKQSFSQEGFEKGFMKVIHPTAEQMQSLKPILDGFAENNNTLMAEYRTSQKESFEELRSEIEPYLTEEQIEKLDDLKKHWQKRFKNKKKGNYSKDKKKNKKTAIEN